MTLVERVAVIVIALALAIGLIAALSGFFAGQDSASLGASGGAIGQVFPDQGNGLLHPGQLRPAYNSDPPTSGAHLPAAVNRQGAELSDDQLLQTLSDGDIVLLHGGRRAPARLPALARDVSGPFTPALAGSGLAVIIARRPGVTGVIALAWRRMLRAPSPSDPRLRAFAEQWLGKGAGH